MDLYLPPVIVRIVESFMGATHLYYYKHNDLNLVILRKFDFDFHFIQSLHEKRAIHTFEYVCYCIFHHIRWEVEKYWDMITYNEVILKLVIAQKATYFYDRVRHLGCFDVNFVCLLAHDQLKQYYNEKYKFIWQSAALNHNRLDILTVTGAENIVLVCDWRRLDVKTLDFLYSTCTKQRDCILKNVFEFSPHFNWARSKCTEWDEWTIRYSLEYLKWAPNDFSINPANIFRMTPEEAKEFKQIRGMEFDFSEMDEIELHGDLAHVMFMVENCKLRPDQYTIIQESTWDYDDILAITDDPTHILHDNILYRMKYVSTSQNAIQWYMTYFMPQFREECKKLHIHRHLVILRLLQPYPEWYNKWKPLF